MERPGAVDRLFACTTISARALVERLVSEVACFSMDEKDRAPGEVLGTQGRTDWERIDHGDTPFRNV
jgi:hypothetical protein